MPPCGTWFSGAPGWDLVGCGGGRAGDGVRILSVVCVRDEKNNIEEVGISVRGEQVSPRKTASKTEKIERQVGECPHASPPTTFFCMMVSFCGRTHARTPLSCLLFLPLLCWGKGVLSFFLAYESSGVPRVYSPHASTGERGRRCPAAAATPTAAHTSGPPLFECHYPTAGGKARVHVCVFFSLPARAEQASKHARALFEVFFRFCCLFPSSLVSSRIVSCLLSLLSLVGSVPAPCVFVCLCACVRVCVCVSVCVFSRPWFVLADGPHR